MKALLLLLSILPGLLIVLYIYWRDRHDREPIIYLTICFVFGMFSTYPAIKMEEFGMRDLGIYNAINDPFMTFTFTFAVVAFSEEFVKYIFLRYYIFPKKEFDEPMDGIVYSVMISMGFATLENILYVVVRAANIEVAFQIGLLRMITAVPGHAIFAILMGYFVGLAKFSEEKGNLYLVIGLVSAILLHGTYDFFIFMQMKEFLVWFTLIFGVLSSLIFLRRHSNNSPYATGNSTEIDLDAFDKEEDGGI
ncbi:MULTISPECIES: PrsW family intramembrane metalloprotease [unclassified Aureispira]|uniref:PrsW family intramembrane metalloprotease n=1 Tax=unclassified Aureispira TaxID=2649989 RepID=UPI0007C6F755|nr:MULTISPECIES: PrsW family glutamic-type intramembrane protease [unclassified Aureispira]WMX16045.1 PrsW family glutamic-type intramembrane protease [Aureispira sp. CCB-E]